MRIITLQEDATCADCGKFLPAGTLARYFAHDKIYCESHDDQDKKPAAAGPEEPRGYLTRADAVFIISEIEAVLSRIRKYLERPPA